MITLIPSGGLANRMRFIASVLSIRRDLSHTLQIAWLKHHSELNAGFHDLFCDLQGIEILDSFAVSNLLRSRPSKFIVKKKFQAAFNRIFGVHQYIYHDSRSSFDLKSSLCNLSHVDNSRHVVVKSWQSFGCYADSLHNFIPNSTVRELVDQRTACFDSNTIGIHIRRTDHLSSIDRSPTHLFVDYLSNYFEENSSSKAFLCTDCPDEYSYISAQFPGKIIQSPSIVSRESCEGIQNALADLLSLSKCKYLLGSFHSSFSELAASYGSIPLVTMVKE